MLMWRNSVIILVPSSGATSLTPGQLRSPHKPLYLGNQQTDLAQTLQILFVYVWNECVKSWTRSDYWFPRYGGERSCPGKTKLPRITVHDFGKILYEVH